MEQINRTKKFRFNFLSNEAARLERAGSYKEAAEVWEKHKVQQAMSLIKNGVVLELIFAKE